MLAVHLRINDAATGQPTAVRLRITGPEGAVYPPHGRFSDFPTGRNEDVGGRVRVGDENWYYTDGSCEVRLPAGVPLRVRATKGPEYLPLDTTVTLGPGQMALRYSVERWSDVRAGGWHPADARCHFLPPHAALLEAAAEDLDVVNLLACVQHYPSQDGMLYPTVPHLAAFSGQSPALEAGGRAVVVNTLNVHPTLGRVGLLNSHRPVFPLTAGGSDATDDWSVCDWCDQCHRKGGLVVWVEPFRPAGGLVGGEALVAAVLGKIDAIESDGRAGGQPFLPWVYRLWNAGFPIPLVGASGKDGNRVALGAVRTYAHTPHLPFSYPGWVGAVCAGRTVVTNGPLISLDVDGVGPGGTVATDGNAICIRATATSSIPFERMDLVADGVVVATATATRATHWSATIELAHTPLTAGWVAVRAAGVAHPPGGAVFAHSSPVLVRVTGRPRPSHPAAVADLIRLVGDTREWVERYGRFENPKRKQTLLDRTADAVVRLKAGG